MRTVVIASQKGGVGKTTIAGHLAVMAESCGHGPVALVDTDPQGSLASWWNERKAVTPLFASVDVSALPVELALLASIGVALAIIDTPPAVTPTIKAVLAVADLVLVPTRPSPHDLRAVGSTVALAAGKNIIFVINGAAARAKITGEAAIELSQYGKVAPITWFQRTDFAASMIDGRTVQELNEKSRSTAEVSGLWSYVYQHLRMSGDTHESI